MADNQYGGSYMADDQPKCLNESEDCQGEVEYHLNSDRDDFKTFARCEFHQAIRLRQADEHRVKYPALPPSDFDPGYAGESWDED